MNKDSRIYLAGHTGMLGAALLARMQADGYGHVLTIGHQEMDLRDHEKVRAFFVMNRPEYVIHAAGRVGGIMSNVQAPLDYLLDNFLMASSVISACVEVGVRKLLYVSSACVYPRMCPQPMKEDALWTGPLEPTNIGYSVAKLAALEACLAARRQHGLNAIVAIPANFYGDLRGTHVVAQMMARIMQSPPGSVVKMLGTGTAKREFIHVDDVADALLFLLQKYDGDDPVNVGSGKDVSIMDLAYRINLLIGGANQVVFDRESPDGMPRKLLDSGRLNAMGWEPKISLDAGLNRMLRDRAAASSAGSVRTGVRKC